MSNKYGSFTSDLLSAIGEATGFFSWPPEGSYGWIRKQLKNRKYVYDSLYRLEKEGFARVVTKDGKRYYKLTPKGKLEILMQKSKLSKVNQKWDGKWRLALFDIPEGCRNERDKLRRLLKQYGYIKLQASVFINPYPLNRRAIAYLKETGLVSYIRFAKVEEMDDDRDLRKKFKL